MFMKCIICNKDSGDSDCCESCQKIHAREVIESVRESKAERDASKAELDALMAAERASIERQRDANRRALLRGYF